MTFIVPPFPYFVGTSLASPRCLDFVGVSCPFSSIGSLGMRASCVNERDVLRDPRLSDHLLVRFWISPRHRDALPPLAASFAKDAQWMSVARAKLEQLQDPMASLCLRLSEPVDTLLLYALEVGWLVRRIWN